MNLRQLTYFVRIVELRNMTQAAASLHVAQPALSQQIALLEDDLGVKLLIRKPRGVLPTTEGRLLYRQAKTILRQVDSIRNLITRTSEPLLGTVSIAMASSTAQILGLPLIKEMNKKHPAIELEIVDFPSADLSSMVLQGRVDIALSPDQEEHPSLTISPLIVEELLVYAHPSLQFPDKTLKITDLSATPMVLPRQPNKLRMRIDYAFLNARLPYQLIAQASTSALLVPAVRENIGITILPYSSGYKDIMAGTVNAYHLDPRLSREISLCISRTASDRTAVNVVLETIKTLTHSLVSDGTWKHCELV